MTQPNAEADRALLSFYREHRDWHTFHGPLPTLSLDQGTWTATGWRGGSEQIEAEADSPNLALWKLEDAFAARDEEDRS